ncbi:hypothetical protein [Streptomyces ziwulingensis]|uniref:hypothetical protein n=1 Tax=Streptomyces ziwulingensis TaxID=1045501 RepID=UPI0031F19BEE
MSGERDGGARGVTARAWVEVACDESGSDGENLTGGNTDVFAHAGVRLPVAAAAASLGTIRERIRSPAQEYKANHLLREKHRAVLEWLLGPAGPLHGRAHVHLTEKTFLVVDRVVGLLLGDPAEAVGLFRAGPRGRADSAGTAAGEGFGERFGRREWQEFLVAANRLLRVRDHEAGAGREDPVAAFLRTVTALLRAGPRSGPGPAAAGTLERLAGSGERARAYRARFLDGPPLVPPLNPLLPAIVATAAHWSAGGRPVRLVHDRQNMLTPDRVAWIEERAARAGSGPVEVVLVVARDDPRVQLADFLAGIARRIASDELNGHGDARLAALLRPYVGPSSLWGDDRSRLLLGAGVVPGAPAR